jgi:hypothetical protein
MTRMTTGLLRYRNETPIRSVGPTDYPNGRTVPTVQGQAGF